MIVYMVALADALFCLRAVPLCLAFRLDYGEGLTGGVGAALFDANAARRKALAPRKPRRSGGRVSFRQLWPMLRRLRVEAVSIRGSLSLGDAAATALLCGGADALGGLLGRFAGQARLELSPAFDAQAPAVRLRGIIRVRVGQIMRAVLLGGVQIISGRIAQWKSTRSKAS